MTANDRLAEIQARAEKATDGPWWAEFTLEDLSWREGSYGVLAQEADPVRISDPDLTTPEAQTKSDAEFIAHARTDVPVLVEALRAVLAVDTDGIRQKYGLSVEGGAVLALTKVHAAIEAALGEAEQ
jgi:hypothetical protein